MKVKAEIETGAGKDPAPWLNNETEVETFMDSIRAIQSAESEWKEQREAQFNRMLKRRHWFAHFVNLMLAAEEDAVRGIGTAVTPEFVMEEAARFLHYQMVMMSFAGPAGRLRN